MSIEFAPVNQEWFEEGSLRASAFFRGEVPDRIPSNPFAMSYCARLFGYTINDWYTNPTFGVKSTLAAFELHDIAPMIMWLYAVYWTEDYGGKIKMPTGRMSAPAVVDSPIKEPEDVDKFEVLSIEELKKGPTMKAHYEALEAAKKLTGKFFAPYQFPYGMYTVAGFWASPERLMYWTNKRPDLVHKIMQKVVDHSVNINKLVADEYGSASIITGSILAGSQTLSPEQCKEFNIRYLKEMVERSLKAGAGPMVLYHLCGDHKRDWRLHDIVPITPATVMHVAYEGPEVADYTNVMEVFGNKCCLLGNFPTTLMQLGSPKEVYDEAKKHVLLCKESPKGYIFGCACELPPFATPGNVNAYMKAAKDYGKLSKA